MLLKINDYIVSIKCQVLLALLKNINILCQTFQKFIIILWKIKNIYALNHFAGEQSEEEQSKAQQAR